VSEFDRLHPALQHHIVNSLGWSSLHPLQEQAIAPLLAGDHALLIAPTAGGKTEAAFFPLLSRMLREDWRGLTLLYVCPLRALLNNLRGRLQHYGRLVGRRVGMWHGDVGQSERRRIIEDPPDCLLITPESLEVILVSRRRKKEQLFEHLRAVVVDEIHAFAGDDRGWHLLAVLERVSRLAGRELQRVGLSATVGAPESLLGWLATPSATPRRVIEPAAGHLGAAAVTLDYVGDLQNAATVIARLHQGEKRLVFCDSRSRVEELAAALRRLEVETFVSHSSLAREERHRAERAFAEGSNCVIVATSTLELGIDVGDLDRVIQIDAPYKVASFLQRLGRTGRRPGVQRNCLFLTTTDETLVRAAGLLRLWGDGYVEPVVPPASPFHILAQQLMALALQQGGIGTQSWWPWVAGMPSFAAMAQDDVAAIVRYMIDTEILAQDSGVLWLGRTGEERFGRQNFMELLSVFTSDPLVGVYHGRAHLGEVDPATFALRREDLPVLLLAGRSWMVKSVDWDERLAYVEPVKEGGKSRWLGHGQPLGYRLCQAIRRVLAQEQPAGEMSKRAVAQLGRVRGDYVGLEPDRTVVLRSSNGVAWWTFGGLCANAAIAGALRRRGIDVGAPDNFQIPLDDAAAPHVLAAAVEAVRSEDPGQMLTPIEEKALADLKFSVCLPKTLGVRELQERLTDRAAIRAVLSEPAAWKTEMT
jgi:ATP-dependent Lhr-like helicase